MIAVCGIGKPSGLLNSATTAYQSASPPMVAASANAATKPNAGCTFNNNFAITNSANVAVSTSVASAFTRLSSAARCTSLGASNEKVPVMTAFPRKILRRQSSRHCERSEAIQKCLQGNGLDCFVACAPRNDAGNKKKARAKRAFELSADREGSGGLGVNLGQVVLRGLGTVGDELAEIFGSRLRPRDEHFAAQDNL